MTDRHKCLKARHFSIRGIQFIAVERHGRRAPSEVEGTEDGDHSYQDGLGKRESRPSIGDRRATIFNPVLLLLPARHHLPTALQPPQTAPPSRKQAFKIVSLQRTFQIQILITILKM